jgi:3-deoxy-D-manno-octulosonic-acid transferase
VYALYSVVTAVLFVLAAPIFLWKGRGTGKYVQTFRERMGGPSGLPPVDASIWVHAVSVGEVMAARPLVQRLKERFPETPVFVSTTTVTGQAVARKAMTQADGLFFAPFDWPRPVRRVLERVRPKLLVLMETEIWPNLIHEARLRDVRIAVVNGRISPRAFRRYLWVRRWLTHVLHEIDLLLMQSETYSDRILAMGAPPERVRTAGNMKFDALSRDGATPALAHLIGEGGPLWIAGSTAEGEDESVLVAFRALRARFPSARLLIAPRRPERVAAVCALVESQGFRVQRRSTLDAPWTGEAVLVLDTVGELARLYSLATIVFVGGSLVPHGGQNVLEAAIYGKAVMVGQYMHNFQEIADTFTAEGALVRVASSQDLGGAAVELVADEAKRTRIGEAARALIDRHRGAVDRTVDALASLVA